MRWLAVICFCFFLGLNVPAVAQEEDPVRWSFASESTGPSTWRLVFRADLDEGWHLYSMSLPKGGPSPTKLIFDKGRRYRLKGKAEEIGTRVEMFDKTFFVDVVWFEGSVSFAQGIKAVGNTKVEGRIEYQVCSEDLCIPSVVRFSLPIDSQ